MQSGKGRRRRGKLWRPSIRDGMDDRRRDYNFFFKGRETEEVLENIKRG